MFFINYCFVLIYINSINKSTNISEIKSTDKHNKKPFNL